MSYMKIDSVILLLCVLICFVADRSFSRMISTEIRGKIENMEIINADPPISCNGDDIINLSDTGLRRISKRIVESANIRSIILANNSIAELLPTAFEGARNLECLDIANNKIPHNEILNLRQNSLTTLIAGYQHAVNEHTYDEPIEFIGNEEFTAVPYTIDGTQSELPNLQHLDLSGIDFRNYPYVTFPRLTHLYLNDRRVREVRDELFLEIPFSLKSLHLKRNTIDVINLTHLAGIEAIYFDSNPLGDADIRLSSSDLKTLSLSNCRLTGVSSTLLQGIPKLSSLDLSSNSIAELDGELFLHTPFLESLSLSKNKFSSIPIYLRFTENLNSLSLSYNEISDLSYPIPWLSLKKLSLRGNKITSIYLGALSSLVMLEELDLAENQLQVLHGVGLQSIKTLQLLDLSYNRFIQIADTGVTQLPKLHKLFMQGNLMTSISELDFYNVPDTCTVYIN